MCSEASAPPPPDVTGGWDSATHTHTFTEFPAGHQEESTEDDDTEDKANVSAVGEWEGVNV